MNPPFPSRRVNQERNSKILYGLKVVPAFCSAFLLVSCAGIHDPLPETIYYQTQHCSAAQFSIWRESDPVRYSGSYEGEFGDTNYLADFEVKATGGRHMVSGVLEARGAGVAPQRKILAPTKLIDSVRFQSPEGAAMFMIMAPPNGGNGAMKGVVIGDLFYSREGP